MFAPPPLPLRELTRMPERFRKNTRSAWSEANLAGVALDCFLEGPAFAPDGALYVVDIPFGRIFRIDAAGRWDLVTEYDGWPNGMKVVGGRLLVADHAKGLLSIDAATGLIDVLADRWKGLPFLGLNDLTLGPGGTIFFTDQGRTGLHDPRGRVFRRDPDGTLTCLIDTCPSPNGLVLAPDGKRLFVAVTRANAIWRIPLLADGSPTKVGLHIQLSGGIGPDGLAFAANADLLVAHPDLGVWRFDAKGRSLAFYEDDGAFPTNLALDPADPSRFVVTDSIRGQILVGSL